MSTADAIDLLADVLANPDPRIFYGLKCVASDLCPYFEIRFIANSGFAGLGANTRVVDQARQPGFSSHRSQHKARSRYALGQRRNGEEHQVSRDLQAAPIAAEPTMTQALEVRSREDDSPCPLAQTHSA